MANLNKKILANRLASALGIPNVRGTLILNTLFDANDGIIPNALMSGDKILMAGFGTFECKKRAARRGTNPSTGEILQIPSKNYISFKVGKTLREKIGG
jgi:DNA-binding protein HU-beta